MEILSKLPMRLKELMSERGINAPRLAASIGVKAATVNRYLEGIRLPNLETLVALVEYFDCSADFLLGLNEYPRRENQTFKPVRPFDVQFRAAMEKCGVSQYALQKKTGISWANFNDWLRGKTRPLADNLVKLALALECSVDFLLGRET